ncbi:uncharacterized protein [Narcine bancroftii]|uniref:uncharacterized protein isoform X5 n=1 Tax=Narcine bancroftii TaxID=1343680 RepID=UPI003831CE94
MIVLLAAFISLSPSISSSKVCASSAQHINTSGLSIQILYPCNNSIEAVAGSKLEITCRVLAELHMGKILMYWLANHTYIEDYSKSNRVKEIRTLFPWTHTKTNINFYQKIINSVKSKHFSAESCWFSSR